MSAGETVEQSRKAAFVDFATAVEARLLHALVPTHGVDGATDATAEALAYGWEHWDRVSAMDNPVGYLFRVAQSSSRRLRRAGPLLPPAPVAEFPWIEPGLPAALGELSRNQRTAVWLVHGLGWRHTEAAELMEISAGTVRTHVRRALASLRDSLGGTS